VVPPVSGGACLIAVYSEPNFAGRSDESDLDEDQLGDWDQTINSIEVKSGTWNFFTEPDFKGDVMRLTPGRYGDLDAKWKNQIGSFMCLDRRS
jgi:hypothetical protein